MFTVFLIKVANATIQNLTEKIRLLKCRKAELTLTIPCGISIMVQIYCINCGSSFRTKNVPKWHGNACKDHEYCLLIMLKKNSSILKYNQGKKISSDAIYYLCWHWFATWKNTFMWKNPEKSSTTKITQPKSCGYS